MARYRDALPQLGDDLFLTDGGIETTLIFHEGHDLPHFASFHLLRSEEGAGALRKYFETYAELAARLGVGLVLESPTWRSNPDWGRRLGYDPAELEEANRAAIRLMEDVRDRHAKEDTRIVISGCVGPRGDGYEADEAMTAEESEAYHGWQIGTFASTSADMVTAVTMNYVEEAEGLTRAAREAGMPVVISFTVETDATLPTGQSLESAIRQVDGSTGAYPAYYMINCAHPSHFDAALHPGEEWVERIRGLRANASRLSHAELDEAEELDCGDPPEFGEEHADLKRRFPHITVIGGCCGTDDRHVGSAIEACLAGSGDG